MIRRSGRCLDTAWRCALLGLSSVCTQAAFAQGRGGGSDWKTAGFDAQRTSWKRTDPRLTPESIKQDFKFLWKFNVPGDARQLNSLTQPVMLDGLHSYTGMRTTLVMGAASGAAYSIDADLGRLEWKHSFGTSAASVAGSLTCPGGITSGFTRVVSLQPQAAGRGGPGGNRGGHAGGAVGDPDQGAPNLAQVGGGGRGAAGGRGGRGGANPPPTEEGGGGRRGGVTLGTTDAFYAVSADGQAHALNVQDGSDLVPPLGFLPANANVSGLMLFDRVLYAATSNGCGGAANGLWAIDLASKDKTVTTWKSNGAGIAGSAGPAAGTDGTLYLATAGDESAVVALEPKTLAVKDNFTPGKIAFGASPVVFTEKGKDWIVAAGTDGSLSLLDSASLGGSDHRTPVFSTPKVSSSNTDFVPGALATWQDADGARWVLEPVAGPLSPETKFPILNGSVTNGAIAAFKVSMGNGTPVLQPAWASRDMIAPATPIIVNGIIFALATGEFHTNNAALSATQRIRQSKPAILYALDAATGKEVWNSGNTITSFVHSGGLSSGNSQVYVSTWDSALYAFGIPMEK